MSDDKILPLDEALAEHPLQGVTPKLDDKIKASIALVQSGALEGNPVSTPLPTQTPNVVVSNPTVRKVVGNILGVASLGLSIATLVDGAIPNVEYAAVTGPAAVIITGLFGIFQLTVTSPNVPSK